MPSTEPMLNVPPELNVKAPVPDSVFVPQSNLPLTVIAPGVFTVSLDSVTPAVFEMMRFPVIVVGRPLPKACPALVPLYL
jgi:hypothetical protein